MPQDSPPAGRWLLARAGQRLARLLRDRPLGRVGLGQQARRERAGAGRSGRPTARLTRDPDGPTLVMLVHPQCTCSRASLTELAELLARARPRPKTYVLFLKPAGFADGWEQTDLWRTASGLPDVTVVRDDEGARRPASAPRRRARPCSTTRAARCCSAAASPAARAHAGDNAGRSVARRAAERRGDADRVAHQRVRLSAVRPRAEPELLSMTQRAPRRRSLRAVPAGHLSAHRSAVRRPDGASSGSPASCSRSGSRRSPGSGTASRTHVHVWAAIFLGGAISLFPAAARARCGPGMPSTRYTIADGADADGRAADPPDRRPDRDALPRLRLARVPRVLPRLARPRPGHDRRRARPHAARHLLAAVGLRRARRQPVALARARGLGRLRGHLPRRLVPPQRRRDAAEGGAHGGARAGGADPAAGRARRVADGGRRPGADARQRVAGRCSRSAPRR